MDNVSVLAITKNGVKLGRRIKDAFPDWQVLAPSKLSDGSGRIQWYSEQTSEKISSLFQNSSALVCIFSLGAVIRLVAPHMRDKKTDPAVIVIDDKANFVISALSGHLGGANELANLLASKLGSIPVVTTAADVNQTISVDLVGRNLGWKIDDDSTVTRVSAHMVNGEAIGVYQDAGSPDWCAKLPGNVTTYDTLDGMRDSQSKAFLIISDRIIPWDRPDSVVYRPPSLVVGVGLHRDTSKDTILRGIASCLKEFGLSPKSVSELASIRKPQDVQGLTEAADQLAVPVRYIDRDELSQVRTPNPSEIVGAFEGTQSVSEAAALLVSNGDLVVEKQKFPPDLTIAVARRR